MPPATKKITITLCVYLVMDNEEMETKKTTALTTVLTSLRKSTNYSIQISAYTRMGDGVLSLPRYCSTEEDGRKMGGGSGLF
jgi:hypothetical protein